MAKPKQIVFCRFRCGKSSENSLMHPTFYKGQWSYTCTECKNKFLD